MKEEERKEVKKEEEEARQSCRSALSFESIYFLLRSQLLKFPQGLDIKMRFYQMYFIQNSHTHKNEPPTDSAAGLACYFRNYIHQICQK